MKKQIYITVLTLFWGITLQAQNIQINENKISKIKATEVINETEKRGVISSVHLFEAKDFQKIEDSYVLKFETATNFTCFGVGWKCTDENLTAGHFKIAFKTEKSLNENTFGQLKTGEGEVSPLENASGIYWSELFFGYDESARKQLFIIITPPEGVIINKIRVDVMDLSSEIDSRHAKDMMGETNKSTVCPAIPNVIQRADWCGSYTSCTNASYTPTVISPTHTVIHHGASPDVYTDGYAVVRSYWNYHVNSMGWSDIGYNYLVDKFGNLFLGRKNFNYLSQDVRGSHAGNSNDDAIGVNFLGNGDVTQPTTIQLQKVYNLLGWWFKSRNINPTSSASITLQSGGSAILTRIVGHKDVNIGGTACPGTTIYGLLGTIRTQTTSVINACNPIETAENLHTQIGNCPNNQVTFSWNNTGTGWYIQVSTSPTYSNPYKKYISNLSSFIGPSGFILQSDGVSPLSFSSGQTYYWRIWDNSNFVNGNSFTMNTCSDILKPSTSITSPTWVTSDFTTTFNDADNIGGSGIKYSFYQVTDLNGGERRSNKNFGFFNDNFNSTLHTDWSIINGNWTVTNGLLKQTDVLTSNSNIYASVSQVTGNQYLYNWKMKISGTGNNRKAGFHFFCEDASKPNRLNSYMIYFNADGNKAQLYEYLNNIANLRSEVTCLINPIIQCDYKVVFNTINGEINVYQNDQLLLSWTDSTPLTIGNQISLRSYECMVEYDDIRVFKSRSSTVSISAGNADSKEIRYQNAALNVSSGNIVSITTDISKNISVESSTFVNLDFWGPYVLPNVNDGTGSDISIQANSTTISANWNATTDPNNTITSYQYAIGTSTGGTNITNWTSNGSNLSFTKTGLNLISGTTYFVSVKSINAAGLTSISKSSNGVQVDKTKMIAGNIELYKENQELNIFPNPVSENLYIAGHKKGENVRIFDVLGQFIISEKLDTNDSIDVSKFPSGVYLIELLIGDNKILKRFVKN